MRFRFPIIGHGFGPGGRLYLRRWRRRRWMNKRRMTNVVQNVTQLGSTNNSLLSSLVNFVTLFWCEI